MEQPERNIQENDVEMNREEIVHTMGEEIRSIDKRDGAESMSSDTENMSEAPKEEPEQKIEDERQLREQIEKAIRPLAQAQERMNQLDETQIKADINSKVTAYLTQMEFKKVRFGGLDRDDVYSKLRDIILRVRDVSWQEIDVAYKMAKPDTPMVETVYEELDRVLSPSRSTALEILHQARLEADNIRNKALKELDIELLSLRSDIAKERNQLTEKNARLREELEADYANRSHELNDLHEKRSHELKQQYEASERALRQEHQERSDSLEQAHNNRKKEIDSELAALQEELEQLRGARERHLSLMTRYAEFFEAFSTQYINLQDELKHLRELDQNTGSGTFSPDDNAV